ncbi:MAG: DUF2760 domain-containing protein [Myxococcales bacterium]
MPFFSRLWLAFVCWFRIVFNPDFARRVQQAGEPLQALAALQREGRLIDFCEEDLAGFSDAQIGAAARTVHDGCRKALRSLVTLTPVRSESEGASIEVPTGFDPRAVRLTGNVVGNPPFKGVLRHHGWRAGEAVIAPAEVELP